MFTPGTQGGGGCWVRWGGDNKGAHLPVEHPLIHTAPSLPPTPLPQPHPHLISVGRGQRSPLESIKDQRLNNPMQDVEKGTASNRACSAPYRQEVLLTSCIRVNFISLKTTASQPWNVINAACWRAEMSQALCVTTHTHTLRCE